MQLSRRWSLVAVLAVLAGCAPTLLSLASPSGSPSNKMPMKDVHLASHRLPKNVEPKHYHIDLDLTQFHLNSKPLQGVPFTGSVRVTVDFVDGGASADCGSRSGRFQGGPSTSKPGCPPKGAPDEIVMHADDSLEIQRLDVYPRRLDGGRGRQPEEEPLKINEILIDRERQLIVLRMARDLPVGKTGMIVIEYRGRTRSDPKGLFVTSLNDRGTIYPQLVAKFRPTSARLVLPCFDEPSFKARFSLTLRHRSEFRPLANMDLTHPSSLTERESSLSGMVTSTFEETPPMPIHMVAFTLAEYYHLPLTETVCEGVELRVITMPGYTDLSQLALEMAAKATIWFERFIDVRFPLKKLDVVAIGDLDTDNMGAWGLAFVKHNLLLFDEESTPDSGISTALNVAHVVVHQWFGNLITAQWWGELWVTEMVAAQMAFQFVAEEYPIHQSEYFVRISTLSDVLSQDSLSEGHALAPSDDQLTGSDTPYVLFDSITFMKSAALARLLQNTLGQELFQAALTTLVRNHCYDNVKLDDLLRAISAHNSGNVDMKQVKTILKSWSTLVSYPVINVDLNEDTNKLIVYQEPFYTASTEGPRDQRSFMGYVAMPLMILFSDAESGHQITVELDLEANGRRFDKELPDWFDRSRHYLIVSPRSDISTYYRIRYSDNLLNKLRVPIETKQLSPMQRLHILNDADALASSQLLTTDTFKELLNWHAGEKDWALIMQMLISAETLSRLAPADPSPASIGQVFKQLFLKYGFNVRGGESVLEQRARRDTLKALVDQNDGEVIAAGLEAFETQADNGADFFGLAPFLRDPVYAAVVKAGSYEQQWALVEHMAHTKSYEERLRLANNLALTKNRHVLTGLMGNLFNSGFKSRALNSLVAANPLLELGEDRIVYVKTDF